MTSPLQIVSNTYVPDEGDFEAPIVMIGESPGTTEREGELTTPGFGAVPPKYGPPRPFIGDSGKKLKGTMLRNGIQESSVRFANLFHYQPIGNELKRVVDTDIFKQHVEELKSYFSLRKTKPALVVPLGNYALEYLVDPPKCKITNWRGSILRSQWKGLEGVKIIPTYHPSAVVRDASLYPIFDLDLKRIFHESQYKEFNYPEIEYVIVNKNPILLEEVTQKLLASGGYSVDIENYRKIRRLACIGFSTDPSHGYCIVWDDSAHTRKCIAQLLDNDIQKTFQYGTHDVNYLKLFGFTTRGYTFDTYIAAHVMYPELPRTLAFLCSVYTREPFYKYHGEEGDEKSWSDGEIGKDDFWKYNIKDGCRTIEIAEVQRKLIDRIPAWKKTFDFEMKFLKVNHDLMQTGMNVDVERLTQLRTITNDRIADNQKMLNGLTDGFVEASKKKKQKSVATINQAKYILHDMLELPVRKNRDGGITVDEDTLVSYLNLCISKIDEYKTKEKIREWRLKQAIVLLMLRLRSDEKLISTYLNPTYSSDGRLRSTYKFGPETGRLASAGFVDDTGLNAQTLPRGEV